MNINKVLVGGRLGADPELTHTSSGKTVCKFSIATSETWMSDGEKQEKTEWTKIVVWGKQAENCVKYLTKGSQAFIEGRLQTRSWEDKDGNKKYTTEVVASSVQFIGKSEKSDCPF